MDTNRKTVLTLFGTRPEVIKLAPIIRELERMPGLRTVNVTTAQHTDLLYPLVQLFRIRIDGDLHVMRPNQTPNLVCARVLTALDEVLSGVKPDVIVVQGDTTTALGGALAAFHHKIPVAHVEAGLRSGRSDSPFPEEMNRRLITKLATWHFAATTYNRETLLEEGVSEETIFLTGNPVVDALHGVLKRDRCCSDQLRHVLDKAVGLKLIVLTTHRRESFGETMSENLRVLREFVESYPDVGLIFPVHPNPSVLNPAKRLLSNSDRIHLVAPLDYEDFVFLLAHSWLIVSDSGGIQEEAPSLGKPVLILRENTERPEAIQSGVARLVGGRPEKLRVLLEEVYNDGAWTEYVRSSENPFGKGDAGQRIANIIADLLELNFETSLLAKAS